MQYQSINPYTEELLRTFPLHSDGEIDSMMTGDIERGKRVARRIDSGIVFINEVTGTATEQPFGDVKNSGYGRELSQLGFGEFVNKNLTRVAA